MQLDIECRNIQISTNYIYYLVEQLFDSLKSIKPFVVESKSARHFSDVALDSVNQIYSTLQKNDTFYYNKLRASRA